MFLNETKVELTYAEVAKAVTEYLNKRMAPENQVRATFKLANGSANNCLNFSVEPIKADAE